MLYGRAVEEGRISELLSRAAGGRSGALELVGEAGGGKTALLDRAVELAGACWRVLRCTGVEGDSELPYSGIHELLLSVGGNVAALPLDSLPEPQADALRSVIGLSAAGAVDRFTVGLAILSLLADIADNGPVLCAIDDVQWLDSASAEALRFAARRIGAEGVVFLFASRGAAVLPGVAELHLPPLDAESSARLLTDRWPGLRRDMRERILREAAGNPLALLEFPRMDLDALPVGPLPLPHRLSSGYRQQIAARSPASRTALLAAAAESAGDLRLVLRVLEALDTDPAGIAEAEAAGLIDVTARAIRFRHPLVRAAVYHGASFAERQPIHAALAAASDDDPDRRAWHLAAATVGPDEKTAALLEAAARRAVDRAGYSAASAAAERAAILTPDIEIRSERMLLAIEWAAAAGNYRRASELGRPARQLPLTPEGRARLGWTKAMVEFEQGNLRTAQDSLFAAAEEVAAVEPERAGPLFVEAARSAWILGDPASAYHARGRLSELRLPPHCRSALVRAVDGALWLHAGALAEGVTAIRTTVAEAHHSDDPTLTLAATGQAMLIGDLAAARALAQRISDIAHCHGMVGRFATGAIYVGAADLMLGRIWEAEETITHALRVSRDIGQLGQSAFGEGYLALIAGLRGDERQCRELLDDTRRAHSHDNFIDYTHREWALGLLDLAHGRYEPALDRLDTLHRIPDRLRGHWLHLLRDLVEAAVRAQQPGRAARAVEEIDRWSAALGSPFAEAIALRCQGLLHADGTAYARALKLQAAEGLWYDHARTALLYGEWLRRERSIGEARTHLRAAVETFERIGALPWAAHARNELRAAGDAAQRSETPGPREAAALTPQELQVARLAAAGATNKEIAAKLFISPKTVSHHLYRAFPKLGVTNRVELARLTSL